MAGVSGALRIEGDDGEDWLAIPVNEIKGFVDAIKTLVDYAENGPDEWSGSRRSRVEAIAVVKRALGQAATDDSEWPNTVVNRACHTPNVAAHWDDDGGVWRCDFCKEVVE